MSFPKDMSRSEERLWLLIEERTKPGADTEAIDERIWDLFGEEWTIMFTDLAGFSRHVATFGIVHFLQVIHEHKKLLLPIIDERSGILVKADADSLLVMFKRATSALQCALEMQHACQEANAHRTPEERMLLCVGLGTGQVLRIGASDVYGAEVNAASKLGEDEAKANEILVTDAFRRAVATNAAAHGVTFEPLAIEVPGCAKSWRARYPLGA
jgi:class 3 adenylate cyclase